jgi:hypothetical protein
MTVMSWMMERCKWPENRSQLELGTISLTAPVPDSDQEQK